MPPAAETCVGSLYFSGGRAHTMPQREVLTVRSYLQKAAIGLVTGGAVWLVTDPGAAAAAGEGLALCASSVIPALFPFLAVSSMLMSMGLGELLAAPLSGLMALYGLPGEAAAAPVLGLIGGYPTGARTAAGLYRDGVLTRSETEQLLAFCSNANPAFLITVLGVGIFGSVRVGVWLWIIHITAALTTGLLVGRHKGGASARARRSVFRAARFSDALVEGVRSALQGTLNVCAFVVFFRVLALPLRRMGGTAGMILAGMTELFSAVSLLPAGRTGFIFAAGFAGWGGVSVLCQTAALLSGTGLSLRYHLRGKALQGILSAALAAALAGYVMG